jgi:hypothetical protein
MTSQADLTAPWEQMDPRTPVAGKPNGRDGVLTSIRGMADNDTLALRPGPGGLALRGHRGTFLVTQEGDPMDHVIGAGDELRTSHRGLVVVWALSDGAIGVCSGPR